MRNSCSRLVCEPVFVGDIRQRERLLSASITVDSADEIKQLFQDFQAAGVHFHQALRKEPWGARLISSSWTRTEISSCSPVPPTEPRPRIRPPAPAARRPCGRRSLRRDGCGRPSRCRRDRPACGRPSARDDRRGREAELLAGVAQQRQPGGVGRGDLLDRPPSAHGRWWRCRRAPSALEALALDRRGRARTRAATAALARRAPAGSGRSPTPPAPRCAGRCGRAAGRRCAPDSRTGSAAPRAQR